ncbi:hypothetical protein BDV38DRAFT_232402 [Aspergillus pseudotamarii]|uniref:Uncharacterized protein n=1 Tax=Aspergillus pseudotamarii TaxID=132259 RepID=A0A5N6TCB3_ASPPS|nr:uncharacterized protein BDV38DRAFT_232402 [Aspergillus pseudotamarii]KAE8143946.1 hypothetical protein BDV38DRAFT_232402 [Aspergillus pseudotamarii]
MRLSGSPNPRLWVRVHSIQPFIVSLSASSNLTGGEEKIEGRELLHPFRSPSVTALLVISLGDFVSLMSFLQLFHWMRVVLTTIFHSKSGTKVIGLNDISIPSHT